jgi:hypothetical protein
MTTQKKSAKSLYLSSRNILIAMLLGPLWLFGETGSLSEFSTAFRNPPDSTRPGIYWYWIGGNVSKEGITKDLEAMKRVGIGRVYVANIAGASADEPVKMFTDEWYGMKAHAFRECGRLGIDMGVFNCPGWSQSGGPWVKPEQSMRYLDASETKTHGPGKFSAVLPAPGKFFQDVAVLAFPEAALDPAVTVLRGSQVTVSPFANGAVLIDGNTNTIFEFSGDTGTKQPLVVDIKCPEKITVRNVTVIPAPVQLKVDCELQYKDQSGRYQTVKRFKIARSGRGSKGPIPFGPGVEAFPPVTAEEFRLIFTGLVKSDRKADENKNPGISEIVLSSRLKLENYLQKQLGQMYPDMHTLWDSYLWPEQTGYTDKTFALPDVEIRNISSFMDAGGRLTWDVPSGDWTILRVGMLPTGVYNMPSPKEGEGLEVDKMNAGHVKMHFDAYLGELFSRLSLEERKAWKYAVVDSYEKGPQNWTDNLQNEFRARYHYDPLPWLTVLTGRVVNSPDQSDRFLWDLRRLVADKVSYDYVGTLRENAQAHGLRLWMENYGHFGFPGEGLQYGGQGDETAAEFWVSGNVGRYEVRIASSANHIYGKPVTSAEAFTSGHMPWIHTPWTIKQRGDWATAEGVNSYILHLYIHQPDERVPGINAWFQTEFNRHNTWFNYMDGWIESFRRTQAVLQQGHYVADLAYFTGEDAPKETGICHPELPPGYNYDFMNGEVILRDLQVRDERFVLPDGMSYRLLVLPPLETMRPELLQKICNLVRDGGAVLGDPPLRSPSLENYPTCDEQIRKLAGELWAGIDGKKTTAGRFGKGFVFRGIGADEALEKLGVQPDIEGIGPRSGFGSSNGFTWIHRRADNADVYFISNQNDEQKSLTLSFRTDEGTPELWDPVTGEMRALSQFTQQAGRTVVPLEFLPRQSYLVAFQKSSGFPAESGGSNFPVFEPVQQLNPVWQVFFDPGSGGAGKVRFDRLTDWTQSANDQIKYYSGSAVYRQTFFFDRPACGRFFLNLGDYQSIARVKLNGRDAGVVWVHPGRVEITDALKAGENELEIDVANTWNNRLLGDSKLPVGKRITWTSEDSGIKPDTQLQPSGLTGPVVIEQLRW